MTFNNIFLLQLQANYKSVLSFLARPLLGLCEEKFHDLNNEDFYRVESCFVAETYSQ